MDFSSLIALLRDPGDDGLPETIYDDLTNAYSSVVDGSAAKVAELQSVIDDLTVQVAALKAQNFDLMMSQPRVDTVDESISGNDDDEPILEALFETVDD